MTRTAFELIGQSGFGYSFDPLTEDGNQHIFSKSSKELMYVQLEFLILRARIWYPYLQAPFCGVGIFSKDHFGLITHEAWNIEVSSFHCRPHPLEDPPPSSGRHGCYTSHRRWDYQFKETGSWAGRRDSGKADWRRKRYHKHSEYGFLIPRCAWTSLLTLVRANMDASTEDSLTEEELTAQVS